MSSKSNLKVIVCGLKRDVSRSERLFSCGSNKSINALPDNLKFVEMYENVADSQLSM
jgi:hypothetical protein